MKSTLRTLFLLLLSIICSCTSDEQFLENSNMLNEGRMKVIAVLPDWNLEDAKSRTSITTGTYPTLPSPVWVTGDSIGIYPDSGGDQLSFRINEGGNKTCSFDGGGWAMKSSSYTAYSPFKRSFYYMKKEALPISMLDQIQKGNDNADHFGAYDIQIAKGDKPENGSLVFQFSRYVALARLEITAPKAATWTSVTLESDALFTTEARMNLDLETPTVAPVTTSNSVALNLKDVSTTDDNLSIIAYMILLPVDLTGKALSVKLTDIDNNIYTSNAAITNNKTNFTANAARWITANDFSADLKNIPYLTFSADEEQTLTMSKAVETLEYSVNGSKWTELGTNTIEFGGEKGTLSLRGRNINGTSALTSNYAKISFGTSAFVTCSGDIRTLLDYKNHEKVSTSSARFQYLFEGCTQLVSAPKLPSETIASFCYSHMFSGCTNLSAAPQLPATTLKEHCYAYMFYGCTNLTTVPELPATALDRYCYLSMFSGCANLTIIPQLPATTLAEGCYEAMFYNCQQLKTPTNLPAMVAAYRCYREMFAYCTSLVSVPELPATSLEAECYSSMFSHCTSLSSASDLPATTLKVGCYSHMFSGCTNLSVAPEISATVLAVNCCQSMFYGCTSLITSPVLLSTTLAESCYSLMFSGCKTLNKITMLATNVSAPNCLSAWTSSVSSTGTFIKAKEMVSLPEGSNGIPQGWTVENYGETIMEKPYVTFTADAEQSLTMSKAVATLEYSVNGSEWTELGTTTVIFGGGNGNLRLRGKSSIGTSSIYFNDYSQIIFGNDVSVACSGDIRTLIDYANYAKVNTDNARFTNLFYNCRNLKTAPELPIENLPINCYKSMFEGCTSLNTPPELPATSLGNGCYDSMFKGCTSLNAAPKLPATNLASSCYYSMFEGCTSLNAAPKLPATNLASSCYHRMFKGCTFLNIAPELPATNLVSSCYYSMFEGCTSLNTAPKLPATNLAESCYISMFKGCTSLNTAPELPATNLESRCYSNMFEGCVSLTGAPKLPATRLAIACYGAMFKGCESLNTAPELSATNLYSSCYSSMFEDCTSLVTAPELPATYLDENCYDSMFKNCSSLATAPELPATSLYEYCYREMFYDCTSLSTAPELPASILVKNCYSDMFNGCKKLNHVTMLAIDITAIDCLDDWLSFVALTGTFVKAKDMKSLPEGGSGIPKGWTTIDKEE